MTERGRNFEGRCERISDKEVPNSKILFLRTKRGVQLKFKKKKNWS